MVMWPHKMPVFKYGCKTWNVNLSLHVVHLMELVYSFPSGKLLKFEIPAAVKLCTEVWSPDMGLVTAAFKLKRKDIQDRYQHEINRMYASWSWNWLLGICEETVDNSFRSISHSIRWSWPEEFGALVVWSDCGVIQQAVVLHLDLYQFLGYL